MERKDFNAGPDEQTFELLSSGRGEWTLEGSEREEFLQPEEQEHQDRLKSWCKAHWMSTFRRSLIYGNKLTYHCCCNSFSRRTFLKQAGHPPLLSIGLLKIPALRDAISHEDLYRWLMDVVIEARRHGQKPLFPAVNRYHVEQQEGDETEAEDHNEQESLLGKRNRELETELETVKKQLTEVRKDNERLYESSANWHSKYNELLERDQTVVTVWSTPKKYKPVDSPHFVDD